MKKTTTKAKAAPREKAKAAKPKRGEKEMAHWKGMPEYVSESIQPYKKLTVNLKTEADMVWFAKVIGQPITTRTKAISIPKTEGEGLIKWRYVDDGLAGKKKGGSRK